MVAALLLRQRAIWPIDAGRRLGDGQPVFGRSKTWRGLICSLLATGGVAAALGAGASLGIGFAALAMAGDLGTSFVKRRLRLPSSAAVPGLDQLPEALLPLAVLAGPLGIDPQDVLSISAVFLVLDLLGTRLVARYKP